MAATDDSPSGADSSELAPRHAAKNEDVDTAELEIIEEVEARLVEKVEARVEAVLETYSGPFPHPEHLERYAALYPRAPEVIFTTFEQQSAHRRDMEAQFMRGNERRANIGQWLAFAIVVGTIGVGLVAVLNGQAVAGGVIIGAAFTGGVVLFIAGGYAKSQPQASKPAPTQRGSAATTGEVSVQKESPRA